jgi:hypothetical protein
MAELFSEFEVNRELRWPALVRLLAASLVAHLIVVISVIYVPGVRDAFNIGSLIANTSFVDKPYEKTTIGDEVQLVELSSNKFHYPEGYFAPEGQLGALTPPPPLPQFIARAQPTFQPAPPLIVPSPSPSPSSTPSPTPVPAGSPAQVVAQAQASPSSSGSPSPAQGNQKMTPDQAQKELEKTAAENHIDLPKEGEINKKALKDFAEYANELKKQGKLDLDKPFEIVIEAELDQDGKLKDPRFTKKAGDPNLVDLFGHMVSALNDSGFLVYLKPLDKDNPGSKIVFTVKQGESEVLATVESETSSVDSARLLAKGFNAALVIGAESRAGKDEEILLKNTSAEPVGNKIIFNVTMPRQAVVDLIKKQLAMGKTS